MRLQSPAGHAAYHWRLEASPLQRGIPQVRICIMHIEMIILDKDQAFVTCM